MEKRSERCCYEPRKARSHQELKEARKDSPSGPSEGAETADTLILASKNVGCFKSPSL